MFTAQTAQSVLMAPTAHLSVQEHSGSSPPAACIAAAGATSEDTTLPMMMKYTDEESVVLSVLNGAICSVLVPVLINACYRFLG